MKRTERQADIEIAAASMAGLVSAGLAHLGEAGLFLGAVGGPILAKVGERIMGRFAEAETAAAEEGLTAEQVLEGIETDERLQTLYLQVRAAVARSESQEKRRLLGRALAHGFLDDARLDESSRLARVLDQIDVPEIRVLDLAGRYEDEIERRGPEAGQPLNAVEASKALRCSEPVAWGILISLESYGLIERAGDGINRSVQVWRITDYGRELRSGLSKAEEGRPGPNARGLTRDRPP